MLEAMADKIRSFLKGMGSVIVLLPATQQVERPLWKPQPAIEDAIGSYWGRVGGHLRTAVDQVRREQEDPDARA